MPFSFTFFRTYPIRALLKFNNGALQVFTVLAMVSLSPCLPVAPPAGGATGRQGDNEGASGCSNLSHGMSILTIASNQLHWRFHRIESSQGASRLLAGFENRASGRGEGHPFGTVHD